jgi:hypothetical protein
MSLDRQNLDALLKQARWPAASRESTRRLEEVWGRKWNGEPRRLGWIWPVAAAATIAIGIGSAIVLVLNPPRMAPGIVSVNPTPSPAAKARWEEEREKVLAAARVRELSQGRPMTMRERMMVGDMRPQKQVATTQMVKVEPLPMQRDPQLLVSLARQEKDLKKQRELIAELLRSESNAAVALYLELVADSRTRRVALDALDDVKEPPVEGLIGELWNWRVAVRFAAARALGRIDGPETTRELVRLIERNTQKREALAALMYSGGPDAAEFMAGARNVPGVGGDGAGGGNSDEDHTMRYPMKNLLILGLLTIFAGGAAAAPAPAADKAAADKAAAERAAAVVQGAEGRPEGQIKVYNISDLLWARKDYPFESAITMPPTMPPTRGDMLMNIGAGRAGRGGGGGAGGGGGGSGGVIEAALRRRKWISRNSWQRTWWICSSRQSIRLAGCRMEGGAPSSS